MVACLAKVETARVLPHRTCPPPAYHLLLHLYRHGEVDDIENENVKEQNVKQQNVKQQNVKQQNVEGGEQQQ